MRSFAMLALIFSVACVPPWLAAQSSGSCRGPDDVSEELVAYLQELVTASDTATVATREMWGLPSASANRVSLVTDATTCTKAADAYSADLNPGNPMVGRQTYVVQVASVYLVYDPVVKIGDWGVYRTLDRKFIVIARVAG